MIRFALQRKFSGVENRLGQGRGRRKKLVRGEGPLLQQSIKIW